MTPDFFMIYSKTLRVEPTTLGDFKTASDWADQKALENPGHSFFVMASVSEHVIDVKVHRQTMVDITPRTEALDGANVERFPRQEART